jgi:hypothetical protein
VELVLLVEEIRGPGENHRPVTSHWQTYIMLYTSPWSRFELTTSVVIGIDCIGSCKSNYNQPYSTLCNRINVVMVSVLVSSVVDLGSSQTTDCNRRLLLLC